MKTSKLPELQINKYYEITTQDHEELIDMHLIVQVINVIQTDATKSNGDVYDRAYLLKDLFLFSDADYQEWKLYRQSLNPELGHLEIKELSEKDVAVYLI